MKIIDKVDGDAVISKRIDVLEDCGIIKIPLRHKVFSAAKKFALTKPEGQIKSEEQCGSEIRVHGFDSDFRNQFMEDGGKIETTKFSKWIRVSKLLVDATNDDIVNVLGDITLIQIQLWELHYLMSQSSEGQPTPLCTNSDWNICQTADKYGEIQNVGVMMNPDGWWLSSSEIHSPIKWLPGTIILTRFQ